MEGGVQAAARGVISADFYGIRGIHGSVIRVTFAVKTHIIYMIWNKFPDSADSAEMTPRAAAQTPPSTRAGAKMT